MMECVSGKRVLTIGAAELAARAAAYPYLWLDLGTGDGRYVQYLAARLPRWMVIGLDTCREQLRERSRGAAPNALYGVGDALALPAELAGLAHRVSVNFPWGSLLVGLLEGDRRLLDGLARLSRPEALLELRLNGGALSELGLRPDEAAARLGAVFAGAGWRLAPAATLRAAQLKALPSSWARRLAHGREPWALQLRAARLGPGGGGWTEEAGPWWLEMAL